MSCDSKADCMEVEYLCSWPNCKSARARGLPHPAPYRPIEERCEILAVELADAGNKDAATVLYEAEALIRSLQEELAIAQGNNRALEEWIKGYRIRGRVQALDQPLPSSGKALTGKGGR